VNITSSQSQIKQDVKMEREAEKEAGHSKEQLSRRTNNF
jgi:hypothetical protein